jgi:hypothetical protein
MENQPPPAQQPLLTSRALTELYMKLGDVLSSPEAKQFMKEVTGPDAVYIPPEGVQDLHNILIQQILTVAVPILWADWELKRNDDAGVAQRYEEWAVWWGGVDPNQAEHLMTRDDEQDARDFLDLIDGWKTGWGVAVRDVSRSVWRPVGAEVAK